MKNDNSIHKESRIAVSFTSWLKKEENYKELFDDFDTSGGDPFDSAGTIDNKLILIEFKYQISKSTVLYKNSSGSSIEKKIGQVLNIIYNQKKSKIFNAIKEVYNELTVPTVFIVAEKISKNASEILIKMLHNRSKEWRFNYAVCTWHKNKVNYLIDVRNNDYNKDKINSLINIPDFPSTSPKRNDSLNDEIISKRLLAIEKLKEYNLFLEYSKSIDAHLDYKIQCVNFKINGKTFFGIWPFKSDLQKGLRMTFEIEKINKTLNERIQSFKDLGISRSKNKLGYLGHNGYVKNIPEMRSLIAKLSEK